MLVADIVSHKHDVSLVNTIGRTLSDMLQIQVNGSRPLDSFIRLVSLGIFGFILYL